MSWVQGARENDVISYTNCLDQTVSQTKLSYRTAQDEHVVTQHLTFKVRPRYSLRNTDFPFRGSNISNCGHNCYWRPSYLQYVPGPYSLITLSMISPHNTDDPHSYYILFSHSTNFPFTVLMHAQSFR